MSELSTEPGPGESLDILSNRLSIIQRRRGHRATTDDILLAWAATTMAESPKQVLDLGTGKGTVGMLYLSVTRDVTVTGVEAFPVSAQLARRNIRLNGLDERFRLLEGDLRDDRVLANCGSFDLILGAPPFMPLGSGVLPKDAQRAAGRFELRGGVEEYYLRAVKNLTPHGNVIVLMDGNGAQRNLDAARGAGLHPRKQINVLPRPQRPATYSICIASPRPGTLTTDSLLMRESDGNAWSARYQGIRKTLDLP